MDSEDTKKVGSGKKARQFDLNALLQETRQSAMERNRAVLESREAEEAETRERLQQQMHISLPQHTSTIGETKPKSDSDSDDDIGPPLPPGFNDNEEEEIGPPLPPVIDQQQPGTSKDGDDSGLEEDDERYEQELTVDQIVPTACEASFTHGSKPVSAICFDAQGSRYATGGYDYNLKLYDFTNMDASFKPFRELQPVECHVITSLSYSCNGENLLICSGNAQVKILDKQGKEWAECVKGDQYIVDMSLTKGHTAQLNGGCFHPFVKEEFLTCSDDGTIRIWSLSNFKPVTKMINTHSGLIKTKTKQGKRAIPICCGYSRDGRLIAAGCDDGSLQLWKHGKLYVNTTMLNRTAHSGPVSSISFSYDNNYLLSRSLDDTLKLFDLRQFKQPVNVADGLESFFPMTECCWSPRDELCVTGTSVRKGQGSGKLLFLDRNTFKPAYQVEYPDKSVVRCVWHPKIDQLMVGLSSGECKIYYDPNRSVRGALQCVMRPVRREKKREVLTNQVIIAPLSHPMFQPRGEEGEEKEVTPWRIKKLMKAQSRDPLRKFKKPTEPPMSGPGAGGRIATSGGTLHSYIAQQFGRERNKELLDTDKDVRQSILKHAEAAEKNPVFVGNAYKRTQPVPIFQEKTQEEEPSDELEPVFKKQKVFEN